LVIGIIAPLANIVSLQLKALTRKAYRAEMHLNLDILHKLATTYKATNGIPAETPGSGENSKGMIIDAVADSTATACNYSNDLGFAISNCFKIRYHYYYCRGDNCFSSDWQDDNINHWFVYARNSDKTGYDWDLDAWLKSYCDKKGAFRIPLPDYSDTTEDNTCGGKIGAVFTHFDCE